MEYNYHRFLYFDLMDTRDEANQLILANAYASQNGKSARIISSFGVYPKRDLSLSENGSKMILKWNNLSVRMSGAIYAVCYNQTDGAYILTGTVGATGKANFPGFVLRPATQVTVFVLQ